MVTDFFKSLFWSGHQMFDWLDRLDFLGFGNSGNKPLELESNAWHETGHVIGLFLNGCVPVHVRVNTRNNNSFVTYNRLPNSKKFLNERMKIIHVGGWALERRHYGIDLCKAHVGFNDVKNEDGDWFKLGQPSVEWMDNLSMLFYDKVELEFSEKIHKEIVEKKRLVRKDIFRLYGEFMGDERLRFIAETIEKEFRKQAVSKEQCDESA